MQKAKDLMTKLQRAAMTQVQSVRFDSGTSPSWINGGEGWTPEHARKWLAEHDFDDYETMDSDDCYYRYKRYDAGEFIGTQELDEGVMVIRCAKR
jgi:hypothetical protein